MKLITSILFLFVCLNTQATTYYVSASGSDANNGTSTVTPFKTIPKINSTSFSPGDNILFNRGDIWIGQLVIPSTGTSVSPIIFGSYGAGAKPIITTFDSLLNAKNTSTWFQRGSTNIWSHSFSGFINNLGRMWLNGTEYGRAIDVNSITSTWRWYFTTGVVDSISVYATSNPATFYSSFSIPSSEVGGAGATSTLVLTDKDWITFDGIDFQGGGYKTIALNGADHIIFQNCNIGRYCNNVGINPSTVGVDKSSDSCSIYNCDINAGATVVYPDYPRDNTGASDAIYTSSGTNGWEISYTTFTGWYHGGVTLESDSTLYVVRNNYTHNNTFDGGGISYARGFATAGKYVGGVSHNIFASNTVINMTEPIQIGGDSNEVYFNTINTMTDPTAHLAAHGITLQSLGTGTYICKGNRILNNTIYNVVDDGIYISASSATTDLVTGNEVSNNIIFGGNYGFFDNANSHIKTTTIKNNIWYKSGVPNFIYYRDVVMPVTTFNGQTTNGDIISGNLSVNPLFVTPGTNFNLQSTSPAINAGINVGLPYSGSAPDIGAYEYITPSTYYVSASGNDANNGTSPATPFKTIAKVNTLTLVADDIVSFNGGDTFLGQLNIIHSGTLGHPITYNSYGIGNAIISGFTTVSSWSNLGGNIWESSSAISTLSNCNMVTIGGINTAMGRTPNTGFYTYQSFSGSTSITSSNLNSSVINWAGAQAVIKKERYVFTKPTIISASGSTLNFADDGYNGKSNWGFFIQNDIRTLDQQNEWYYSPTTHKIDIYSTTTPTNVQVASVSDLVTATNVSYINFDGITFTGANAEAFYTGNFSNSKIQNCNFDFNYQAFQGKQFGGSSANLLINNCSFNHTNNDCIDFSTEFTSPTITNNVIKNTATFEGMMAAGQSGWAMNVTTSNALIQYNEVDTSGYIGIGFNCTNSSPNTIKNNYVNYFCYLKDDGGGIYSGNPQVSQIIDSNIVVNGIGNNTGINSTALRASGIYCDDNSSGFTIRHNSIGNISYAGIFLHNANNNTVTDNTIYACGLGELIDNDNTSTFTTNIYSHQNKIIAQTTGANFSTQDQRTIDCATAHTSGNDIRNFGDIDSNYYARPIDDNLTIRYTIYGVADADASLYQWQTYSLFDTHSHKSPVAISNVNQLFFAYSLKNDTTIIIPPGTWIDVTGTPYNTGSTILHAYSSIILISTGTNIPPIANAGTNINITLPTNSFTQSGSGTDQDGSIVAYNWTQFSGPSTATIGSPTSATSLMSNLIAGTYVFQLKVTDNNGATSTDTMSAVVNNSPPPNQPPVVDAGGNKIITLPTSSVTQSGSATDPDGTIASYLWTAGPTNPTTATIASPTNPVTVISGMTVAGVYRFILTATDNLGATGSQSITVTVNAIVPVPPTAHAGVDQSITWPTNSVTLSGTATAGTGTIASYFWRDISGDASIITNPNSASTTVTSLNIGIVKFELTVTDNSGFQGKDTMQVTVNKGTASLSFSTPTLTQTWTGLPLAPTIITVPSGLATSILYNGIGATPIEPGMYNLVANITDLAHWNSTPITGVFVINKATATFTITNTTPYFNNTPQVPFVTTNPANLTGVNIASPHTNPGTYSDTITLNNAHYQATQVITPFIITTAGASIVITGNQNLFYTGSPISVIAVTNPFGLTNTVTYNGSLTPPTVSGTYQVIGTITQVGYSGADTVTMIIQKANTSNTLSWAAIPNAQEGTALNGTQLSATSTLLGVFTYSLPLGYILSPGVYTITATFHPTDSANYNTSTINNTITVYGSPFKNYYIKHGKTIYLNSPNQ